MRAVLVDHQTPVGSARGHAEAEERQAGEPDQGADEAEQEVRDDRRQHVGQDVVEDDPRLTDTSRVCAAST